MLETPITKESNFICHIAGCSRSFKHREHLNRHQASHGGLRLYQCLTCSHSFTRSDTLNRHMLLHDTPPKRSKRISIACQTCRKRKIRCDTGECCLTCYNLQVPCVRIASSTQNPHDDMNKKAYRHSICDGKMAQTIRGAESDLNRMPCVPQSYYDFPMHYPLEGQDIMADIAIPWDMAGDTICNNIFDSTMGEMEWIQPVDVHSPVRFPIFDQSSYYQGMDGH